MLRDAPKLSRFEILGAWLGIWTPPRDAAVPPVPWRRLGIGALVVAVLAAGAAALIVPRINDSKAGRAATEQRRLERARAADRAALVREQRARAGRARGDRAAVLAHVEQAIGRDARGRFDPAARTADCRPAGGADIAARKVAFDCFSATRDIVAGGDQAGARGTLAIPFRAVVDFAAGTYAFCKVNPPPGEQVITDPGKAVELPAACRLPAP